MRTEPARERSVLFGRLASVAQRGGFIGGKAGWIAALVAALVWVSGPGAGVAAAQLNVAPSQVDGVGTADKRGTQVNRGLVFTGYDGNTFKLGDYCDGSKPVILLLAYYDCPLLCTLMIDSVRNAVNESERYRVGRDFSVLVVSIDHTNTVAMASAKQQEFVARYVHQDLTDAEKHSIMFAVSEPGPVRELADSVGYYYRYLPKEQEFAHPPAIYFLTPDGVVSTMLLGVNTPAKQVALALNEASNGRTASFIDSIGFSCFMYNPLTGQYVISPMNVMRLGASAVAVLLLGMIGGLFLRGWLKHRAASHRMVDDLVASVIPDEHSKTRETMRPAGR